jgi:C_GCAxxG_C_C family probable redox protein
LNCAETLIYAADEEYNLKLSKDTFKAMAAFGGGMAVEGVCGAAAGAAAVLGILFTKVRSHESDRVKTLTSEFMNEFQKELGTHNCKELKGKFRNDDARCTVMIETAAKILDNIVAREIKNKDSEK